MENRGKKVLIIGAGPAGLTAAYELLDKSQDFEVIILEESGQYGGISKTVVHNGNRMDMGGHRFFSKVPAVNEWWGKMLPTQGKPAYDDVLLGRTSAVSPGGPDPETDDRVMLRRNRLSRIFFNRKFFDYPISLKYETIKNMGLLTTVEVGFSYLYSVLFKREEKSLEDFYINRFGKKLYSMFFEQYTANLWGRHPREISPDWGAQRVKGLSIKAIIVDIYSKLLKKSDRKTETSLIEEFGYPKLGPGQLWELTAEAVLQKGGKIIRNAKVTKILNHEDGSLSGLIYEKDGEAVTILGDYIISSMPVKDLIAGMSNVPENVAAIARDLPYRDYITIGMLVPEMSIKNQTKIPTIGNIIPDNWVYIHDKNVKAGRIQIYNNWSPYLVKDPFHHVWIGLEYFCNEGDALWTMEDDSFRRMAVSEMVTIGLIRSGETILDYHIERVKKAYPAYFDSYEYISDVRSYLDTFPNLFCVGRNGQHRYNNIDHSMCTSFEAVHNILFGITDKDNVWNVNTEQEYHEQKGIRRTS